MLTTNEIFGIIGWTVIPTIVVVMVLATFFAIRRREARLLSEEIELERV
jgi:hypothetical protein